MQHAIVNLSKKQAANYAKLDKKFESMQVMIEALMNSSLTTLPKRKLFQYQLPFLDPNQTKQQLRIECWNQTNLEYFNPHFDKKVYGPSKLVSVGKDVHY